MSTSTLEERLILLEAEMATIKAQLNGKRVGVVGRTRPDFLQNYTRRSPNTPLFEEVMQEIEKERERERNESQKLY